MRFHRFLVVVLAAGLAGAAAHAADKIKPLDEGLLDPSWFGVPGIEFRALEDVDYFWVKPGFQLAGRKIQIEEWSDPKLMGKERDAKDSAKAVEVTDEFPGRMRGALMVSLAGVAEVSRKEGDLALTGRIVDCNAGSKAAKWLVGMGAGAASATWDMKLVDKASGEVVLALHHRAISGTSMSEIDDKVIKWLEELGDVLKGDLAKQYQAGKKPKK